MVEQMAAIDGPRAGPEYAVEELEIWYFGRFMAQKQSNIYSNRQSFFSLRGVSDRPRLPHPKSHAMREIRPKRAELNSFG